MYNSFSFCFSLALSSEFEVLIPQASPLHNQSEPTVSCCSSGNHGYSGWTVALVISTSSAVYFWAVALSIMGLWVWSSLFEEHLDAARVRNLKTVLSLIFDCPSTTAAKFEGQWGIHKSVVSARDSLWVREMVSENQRMSMRDLEVLSSTDPITTTRTSTGDSERVCE